MSNADGRLDLKSLVKFLAIQLVDKPDQISVKEICGEGTQTTVVELTVGRDDVGKVIGRQGKIADAMRTILHSAAARDKKRVIMQITEYDKVY